MKISIRQLEIFDAVATLGSLTAAADKLGISPSSASSALTSLQDILGRPLFAYRKGRSLEINAEGRRLQPLVRSLLSGVQDIKSDAGPLSGQLIVGTTAMIAETMLPELCVAFRKRHPEVQIMIESGTDSELLERMMRLEFETVLVENFPHIPSIELTRWRHDELCLVADPEHPLAHRTGLTIRDLIGVAWCMREHNSTVASRLRYLLHDKIGQVPIAIQATSNSAVRLAIIAGGGIGCLSAEMVADDLASGRLVQLDVVDFQFRRVLSLARPRGIVRNRLSEAFDAFLMEHGDAG